MIHSTVNLTGVAQRAPIYASFNDVDAQRKRVFALNPEANHEGHRHDPGIYEWIVHPVEGEPNQIRLMSKNYFHYLYVEDGTEDTKDLYCWKTITPLDIMSKGRFEVEQVPGSPGVIRLRSAHHPGRPYIYITNDDFDSRRRYIKAWCGAGEPSADILARAQIRLDFFVNSWTSHHFANQSPQSIAPPILYKQLIANTASAGLPSTKKVSVAVVSRPEKRSATATATDAAAAGGASLGTVSLNNIIYDGATADISGTDLPLAERVKGVAGHSVPKFIVSSDMVFLCGMLEKNLTVVSPFNPLVKPFGATGPPAPAAAALPSLGKEASPFGTAAPAAAPENVPTAFGFSGPPTPTPIVPAFPLGPAFGQGWGARPGQSWPHPAPPAGPGGGFRSATVPSSAYVPLSLDFELGESLASLPEGARPSGIVQLLALADCGEDDKSQTFVMLSVFPTGEVQISSPTSKRLRRISLDGLRFKTEAPTLELDVPEGVDAQRPGSMAAVLPSVFFGATTDLPFARAGLHIGQHCCHMLGGVFKRVPRPTQIEGADDEERVPAATEQQGRDNGRQGVFGGGGGGFGGGFGFGANTNAAHHTYFGGPPAPRHNFHGSNEVDVEGGVWREGDVIATLPEGARPRGKMVFACLAKACPHFQGFN